MFSSDIRSYWDDMKWNLQGVLFRRAQSSYWEGRGRLDKGFSSDVKSYWDNLEWDLPGVLFRRDNFLTERAGGRLGVLFRCKILLGQQKMEPAGRSLRKSKVLLLGGQGKPY